MSLAQSSSQVNAFARKTFTTAAGTTQAITDTNVSANSMVVICLKTDSSPATAVPQTVAVKTLTAGTSFTITKDNADVGVVYQYYLM